MALVSPSKSIKEHMSLLGPDNYVHENLIEQLGG